MASATALPSGRRTRPSVWSARRIRRLIRPSTRSSVPSGAARRKRTSSSTGDHPVSMQRRASPHRVIEHCADDAPMGKSREPGMIIARRPAGEHEVALQLVLQVQSRRVAQTVHPVLLELTAIVEPRRVDVVVDHAGDKRSSPPRYARSGSGYDDTPVSLLVGLEQRIECARHAERAAVQRVHVTRLLSRRGTVANVGASRLEICEHRARRHLEPLPHPGAQTSTSYFFHCAKPRSPLHMSRTR